jgi:hypothetical protein
MALYWARNLTSHHHLYHDPASRHLAAQFYYGDLGRQVVRHIYYALIFCWITAGRKGWI